MGYAERNAWAQVAGSIIGAVVYVVLLIPQFQDRAVYEIEWVVPVMWNIGTVVVISIVLSIALGVIAGTLDPEAEHHADQRDREIERFGSRIGQAFLIAGSLGALVLAMVRAEWFWIGNTILAGFFLFAVVGGIARVLAYRRGFQ